MKIELPFPDRPSKGVTVRFANNDIDAQEALSKVVSSGSVNRLGVIMTLEIIHLCQALPFALPENSALIKLTSHSDKKVLWREIAQRDVRRTLPNAESKPVKLTFTALERQRLLNLSRQLEWAAGQIVLAAIQAFCTFAGAERPIEELPAMIRLARGSRILTGGALPETEKEILDYLNNQLRPLAKPPQKAFEAQQAMTSDIELI